MHRFTDSLLIIMVVYNRALEACESFQSILRMRDEEIELNLFVYDNSAISQSTDDYKGLKISYFHDPENSGVSKAYNTGARFAKENGKQWVLLLDQDTGLPPTIIKDYANAIDHNPNLDLFVPILKLKNGKIFSPFRYRFKRGFYLGNVEPGIHSLNEVAPVNSGMMVRADTFLKVGGYNDKVKLDFSDFQFIERYRRHDTDFYVMDVVCLQDFSDDDNSFETQKKRFGFFCEGAKNIEKRGSWERIQYNNIVLARALKLSFKYKSTDFLRTYFSSFVFASGV